MEKYQLISLLDRYLSGSANQEEMALLLAYYQRKEIAFSDWEADLMGDESQVKTRIFSNISSFATNKGRPTGLSRANLLLRVAAILVFCLSAIIGLLLIRRAALPKPASLPTYTHVSTRDKTGEVILPDGTRVWLNKNSVLSYLAKFEQASRIVTLSGEAYFEVVHKQARPFIIVTESLHTRVLGTRFVVSAPRGENRCRVSVVEGKVKISRKGMSSRVLTSYQLAEFDEKTALLTTGSVGDLAKLLGWTGKQLAYRNVSFQAVAADLSRIFSIQISLDKHLRDCLIHADFQYSDSAEQIAHFLAMSVDGAVVRKTKTHYHLTGKGCN